MVNRPLQDSNVNIDQALFQPFPSEVRFQQFQQHKTYEFPLKFRNLDSVAHNLRVTGEDSPYFSITCQRPVGMKIAPGMEVIYDIIFTPEQNKVKIAIKCTIPCTIFPRIEAEACIFSQAGF